jgi:hypothetical protein
MSVNGRTVEEQKQWDQRNSDRRDTFEGVLWGQRTGEVRTIDHVERELGIVWRIDGQEDSSGTILSDPAQSVRGVHIWPSDVSPPAEGAMMFADQGSEPGLGSGNGYASEPDVLVWETYTPAADGD